MRQPSYDLEADEPSLGRLMVHFNEESLEDKQASLDAGRPVFKDVEFITIVVPGDKNNVIHRPVREDDRKKYRREYDNWKAGKSEQVVGTPLAEWPGITRSQANELAHFHVRTVEHLAEFNDTHASGLMGIQALKQRARDYLEKAKGNAPLEKMRAELASRDNQIQALQQQLAQQAEVLSQLQKQQKKNA